MDTQQLLSHVQRSLAFADANQSKLSQDVLQLTGCSGTKTKHFLNNLMSLEGVRYLDVGTCEGSSVCSAAYGNSCEMTVVDNYQGDTKDLRVKNMATWANGANVTVLEKDPFRVNVTKELKKYNVYLYDGPDHSNLGHYRAIQHFYRSMDDVFVLLIDDWNWPDVKTSTANALKGMRLNKLFEREIVTGSGSDSDWWNGLYVAVLEKSK